MKKRMLSILLIVGNMLSVHALTLEECTQLARDNYPAIKQYGLISATKDYDLENAGRGWLPQISLQAGGYAFTDVLDTESRIGQMGINMKNYVVGGNLALRQTVYDGGQIAAGKKSIAAKSEVDARQTDVTLYNIKVRTQELYFGVLLIREQMKQNCLLQQDLQVSIKTVEEMMRGGIANQTDRDALQVELIRARQQYDAYNATCTAYLKMLGTFIGKDLNSDTILEKPAMTTVDSGDVSLRPEMTLFSSQDNLLNAQRKKLDAELRPTVGFVGMGMLHTKVTDVVKPGLLLGGLSVSWNIGALYTRKNDIRKLEMQRQQNDVQRQTFIFQNRLQREETDGNITALRKQLANDREIVRLRERIRSLADRKVAAGTESVNELVRDINAVSQARGQRAIHEIQLLKAIYSYRMLINH